MADLAPVTVTGPAKWKFGHGVRVFAHVVSKRNIARVWRGREIASAIGEPASATGCATPVSSLASFFKNAKWRRSTGNTLLFGARAVCICASSAQSEHMLRANAASSGRARSLEIVLADPPSPRAFCRNRASTASASFCS